jgi:hypothetical protein
MNITQTDIAVAEELGVMRWTYLDGQSYPDTLRYTKDLDAMHQAIMSLTLEEQCSMTEYLHKEVLKFKAPTITATAAQLAEAFLDFRYV